MPSQYSLILILLFIFNLVPMSFAFESTEMIPTKANIIGNYSDQGVDINSDGSFDILRIGIEVFIPTSREYSLMGYLFDLGNKEVAWSIDHENLSAGYHIMYLNYNCRSILEHMVNGPYHLRDLTLLSGSSDTSLTICDYAFEPYPTYAYNCTDFSDEDNHAHMG